MDTMSSTQQFCKNLDSSTQRSDSFPLVMANTPSTHQFDTVNITHESSSSISFTESQTQDLDEPQFDSNTAEPLSRHISIDIAMTTPRNISFAPSSPGQISDDFEPHYRANPLNSGLWISIELTSTISQIFACIIVLSLSRDETPQTPLSVWIAGYAAGCFATLPLLYWRYTLRYARHFHLDTAASQADPFNNSDRQSSYHITSLPALYDEVHDNSFRMRSFEGRVSTREVCRVGQLIEKFRIALDCFFAVWFVVGNVWIFGGGHPSYSEAPILYWLCVVFLTFSCIGYAMPFILCAIICCCLPCIVALLGFREEQPQGRGASPETIASIPAFKFKSIKPKMLKISKEDNLSDSENFAEGGFLAAGIKKGRSISADDALCCICLGYYKDGVDLRELPCTHHFHVGCVDKWLNISATCPLCKHEVCGSNCRNK